MHVRRATRGDIADIATVVARAMMEDELNLWLSPDMQNHPDSHRRRALRTTTRRWNSGLHMYVAVTDEQDKEWNGKPVIIGYAAWEKEVGAPDDSSKLQNTWSGAFERFLFKVEDNWTWYLTDYYGTDKNRWRECRATVSGCEAMQKYDKYWELDFLAVEPSFGRRGIGAQFLKWGQEQATKDNVPLLLWSSVKGFNLYKRHGFVEIASMTFGDEIVAPVMAWTPPHSTEAHS